MIDKILKFSPRSGVKF